MPAKIIGCGSCGNSFVNFLSSSLLPKVEYYSLYLNSEKFQNEQIKNTFALEEIPQSMKYFFLKGILYNANPCFILAGLGGTQGSSIMLDVIVIANELNIKPHVIATTPFEFEMTSRKQRAEKTLVQLGLLNCHLSLISNANIMERFYHFQTEEKCTSAQQQAYEIIQQRIQPITYSFS